MQLLLYRNAQLSHHVAMLANSTSFYVAMLFIRSQRGLTSTIAIFGQPCHTNYGQLNNSLVLSHEGSKCDNHEYNGPIIACTGEYS